MGFPSWVDSWGTSSGRGTSALAHVGEVRSDLPEPAGIAIWDLQLSAAGWRASTLWGEIALLKGASGGTGNRAPVAQSQSLGTHLNTPVAVVLGGSDPDHDPLTFGVATHPAHGTLSGAAPSLTYTPTTGYVGDDRFTFTVSDGVLTSAPATVSLTISAGPGPLPAGWTTADIGPVGIPGSAAYDVATAAFTVTGSGTGVSGTADQFRYAWQTLSGDGEIRARISDFHATPAGALAGVMIRAGTTPDSPHHFVGRRNDGAIVWLRRNGTGRSTSLSTSGTTGVPCWVRLVRSGTTITAYKSVDGKAWTRVNNAKLSMGSVVTAGLVVSSGSNASLATAGFDAISVVP
jgi:hypothetical protein